MYTSTYSVYILRLKVNKQ